MQIEQIDPRTARWEIDFPAYRVYFWTSGAAPCGSSWASSEWRLSDADADEVLAWAAEHAAGRYVTSWVEVELDGEPGLIRLSGWEPTRAQRPPTWVATRS